MSSEDFKEFGIAVFDSDGEMRNMADIVGDMETAFAGMSVEQRGRRHCSTWLYQAS
jgi:hypothetical protein